MKGQGIERPLRVISLTAIPPRFAKIGPALFSLLQQRADEVRLYLPRSYRRFPDWDGVPPSVPAGVTIHRCEEDLGPATKVLPAARDLRGHDAQILFCDDDTIVGSGWADRLFRLQAKYPKEAVASYVRPVAGYVENYVATSRRRARQLPIRYDLAYRASRLAAKLLGTRTLDRRPFVIPGHGEILFGVGGAVVRPEFFDDTAFDIPAIAWMVDDIWLSAQLARLGIPIRCPWLGALPRSLDIAEVAALADANVDGLGRQDLNRAAARHCQSEFGIWKP